MFRLAIDPDNELGRVFSELERTQLPFAAMQASNATAFAIRTQWQQTAPRVFDRPSQLTVNAALYTKATKARPFAEVFVRDEALKGTPPSKYLLPQVQGGTRAKKGFEKLLQAKGAMPAGTFAVPGQGAQLDQNGNVAARQISAILSQVGARNDALQNTTEASTRRRRARKKRGGEYFALPRQHGRLLPGIYERIATGFGSAVRSVLVFVRSASYRPRYDIFGMAERSWNKLMPFHFDRELAKAVASAVVRGRR